MRRKLRKAIRQVQEGGSVEQASTAYEGAIPSYGGDTILRIRPQADRDDEELLKEVAHKVAEIYMNYDDLQGRERSDRIRADLKAYEESWA